MVIGLKLRGVDVEVMTPRACSYAERMAAAGIPIHDYLPATKFSGEASKVIREVLRQGGHDLQYLFNNPAIATGLRASRGLATKNVTYRGQVGNVSRYDPTAYLTHMHPRVDRIICVANAVCESLRKQLWQPHKAVTIYKGHDIQWYANTTPTKLQDLGIPANDFVIACVANNRPRKGVPVLLRAMSQLPRDTTIRLLLIGGGMDSEEVGQLLAGNPLRERIHRFGHRDDVLNLVASAQAAVLPAIRREGLPKTVIEAMALGLPPIVTRTGGSPELVAANKTGLIVDTGDATALARAMQELAADPQRAKKMGEASKQRLINKFNLQTSVDNHLEVFNDLMSGT